MKRLFFLLLIIQLTTLTAFAQGWLDIGVKGAWGPTFIINNNVWNDKNIGNVLSYGNFYGGKIGFNFNEYHQITSDVTKSKITQQYTIKSSDSLTYNKHIQFTTLDISFLYRSHTEGGGYIEIGPQYSMLKNAKQNLDVTSNGTGEKDVLAYFNSSYYSVVFGFGANFMGGNNVSLLLGARMVYGFNDLVSEEGKSVSFPMNDSYYTPAYTAYKATRPFTAMLVAELTYDLGFFAHSSCGKGRTKFISFD